MTNSRRTGAVMPESWKNLPRAGVAATGRCGQCGWGVAAGGTVSDCRRGLVQDGPCTELEWVLGAPRLCRPGLPLLAREQCERQHGRRLGVDRRAVLAGGPDRARGADR